MKPGRKLIDLGAGECTDAEILAILLGSGGRGYSALDAARAVLEKYGTLAGLMDHSLDELAAEQGVAGTRVSVQELGGWPRGERDDGFERAVARWRRNGAGPALRRKL